MEELPEFALIASPLVLGLIAALRQAVAVGKWAGLAAIGLGVALGVGWSVNQDAAVFNGIIHGVIAGLTASGLWSTTKNSLEKQAGS